MAPPRVPVDAEELRRLYVVEGLSYAQVGPRLGISPALVPLRLKDIGVTPRRQSGINVGACSIPGCRKRARARTWCVRHYQHWRAHGDPLRTRGTERHGQYLSLTYRSWAAMLLRCTNPRTNGYENYGGRGIRVCDEWRRSYVAFRRDVGRRPSRRHTLDRIDPNGHYEPGNVRWATAKQQRHNRRDRLAMAS